MIWSADSKPTNASVISHKLRCSGETRPLHFASSTSTQHRVDDTTSAQGSCPRGKEKRAKDRLAYGNKRAIDLRLIEKQAGMIKVQAPHLAPPRCRRHSTTANQQYFPILSQVRYLEFHPALGSLLATLYVLCVACGEDQRPIRVFTLFMSRYR